MVTRLGSGKFTYEVDVEWAKIPQGWTFKDVVDVTVDVQDRVYMFCRGEHPLMIFERDGSFISAWGEGQFVRPHALTPTPDGYLFCVDDNGHSITKRTLDGEVVMTLGTPGQPAPAQSNLPFNRPTKVALDPQTGDIYVSDGYGNARIHKYTPDGKLLFSWGDYGTDPGDFNLPHSVCTDREGRVYVADRENHRVQIFDREGKYITQWNNLHRPCGVYISNDAEQLCYIGQLGSAMPVNVDSPNLGARVDIYTLRGERLARLGAAKRGNDPGQFVAPHGVAVDSHGDIYVAEVSWSDYGSKLNPSREFRCFRKLVKV
jgi:DNA-binding beta-propeller fold protein YncE